MRDNQGIWPLGVIGVANKIGKNVGIVDWRWDLNRSSEVEIQKALLKSENFDFLLDILDF